MKRIIYLHNRYYGRDTNYLEMVGRDRWSLHVKNPDFVRYIYKENQEPDANDYFAVDPDGGPFMSIGYELEDGKKINKIYIDDGETIIETVDA